MIKNKMLARKTVIISKCLALVLLLASFFATLFFAPPLTADACTACMNMWANQPVGTHRGITFEKYDYIKIQSKTLDISFFQRRTANIVATYSITNTADRPITTNARFYAPVYFDGAKAYSITKDTQTLSHEVQEPSPSPNTSVYPDWCCCYEWHFYRTQRVLFDMHFEPNQTLEIVISYAYHANTSAADRLTIMYGFSPNQYWQANKSFVVNLNLYEGHLFNSNLDFERLTRRNYQLVRTATVNDSIRIVMSSNPRGFAFLRWGTGGVASFFTVIGVLALLAFMFCFFVVFLIKRLSKGRLSNASFLCWLLFLIFSIAVIVWIVLIFLMMLLSPTWLWILIFGIFAFITLVPAIGFLIPAIIFTKRHKQKNINIKIKHRPYY